MSSAKKPFNVLLAPRGFEIVYFLQERYGVSQSGLVEMLLRDRLQQLVIEENVDPANLRRLSNLR